MDQYSLNHHRPARTAERLAQLLPSGAHRSHSLLCACAVGLKPNSLRIRLRGNLFARGIGKRSASLILIGLVLSVSSAPTAAQQTVHVPLFEQRSLDESSTASGFDDQIQTAVTHSAVWVTGAKVTGAKVTGAKVTGAKVTEPQVTGAQLTEPRAKDVGLHSVPQDVQLKQVPFPATAIPVTDLPQRTDLPQQTDSAQRTDLSLSGGSVRAASLTMQDVVPSEDLHSPVTGVEAAQKPFLDLTPESSGEATTSIRTVDGHSTQPFTGEQFVTVLMWLLILTCTMILCLLGLRKWQRTRGLLPVASGQSRVLQTLSLGPGRTVSLIEMNGLRALVGADAGGIRTIVLAPQSFDDSLSSAVDSEVPATLLEA